MSTTFEIDLLAWSTWLFAWVNLSKNKLFMTKKNQCSNTIKSFFLIDLILIYGNKHNVDTIMTVHDTKILIWPMIKWITHLISVHSAHVKRRQLYKHIYCIGKTTKKLMHLDRVDYCPYDIVYFMITFDLSRPKIWWDQTIVEGPLCLSSGHSPPHASYPCTGRGTAVSDRTPKRKTNGTAEMRSKNSCGSRGHLLVGEPVVWPAETRRLYDDPLDLLIFSFCVPCC